MRYILDGKSKLIVLTNDEREELIQKFITENKSYDMSMLIITQPDMTFNDLFVYGDFLSESFYLEVSQCILNYLISLTERGNFSEVIMVIQKMDMSVYIPTFGNLQYDKTKFRIEDYTQSNILCSLIYYLVEYRKDEELMQLLNILYTSNNFPEMVIDMIIFDSRVDFNYKIIKDVLFNEYLSRDVFLDNFYKLEIKYDEEFLTELLLSIFTNRVEMIEILIALYKRYVFYKSSSGYVTELNPIYNNEQYVGFEFILKRIKEIITLDVETDFYYNFLDKGKRAFINSNDRRRSIIYDNLEIWYTGILEKMIINKIFLEQNYVDKELSFPLNNLDIMILVSDVNCLSYILALTSFDIYNSLIRIINLSRFEFFKVRRKSGIEELIGDLIDEDNEHIYKNFLNNNFLCFIFKN